MKRLIFLSGEIEFYPSKELSYNRSNTKRIIQKNSTIYFVNYKGYLGTTPDIIIEAYNSSVSGKLRVPAFMDVKECIDLQVSPELKLSVRSIEQGLVNNQLMTPLTPRYAYGDSISNILKNQLASKEISLYLDLDNGYFNVSHDKKNTKIYFYDFCKVNNLVYIDSLKAPIITTGYDEEDIVLADDKKLKSLEEYFVKAEKYENAAKVLKRLKTLEKNIELSSYNK
ncbi:MAG: hypothetical protein KatS3mg002_0473 [Candidatus Woesearchaeota archaeon]|nr:MAG: hypothetical protein KatS3mg002_0473 [Candidatus Woesearchaeota archaeon]